MKQRIRRILQNLAIGMLFLIALKNLAIALPWKYVRRFEFLYGSLSIWRDVTLHQTLSFILGLLMLLMVFRLWRRVRLAWIAEVLTLTLTILLQFFRYHQLTMPIVLIEAIPLAILLASYQDFSRRWDRLTLWKASGFVAASLFLLLLNASVGIFMLKSSFTGISTITDAVEDSVNLLFYMDKAELPISGAAGNVYADSLIAINWTCLVVSAFLLLKPLAIDPIGSRYGLERARRLVLRYGWNPMAYLALEKDKRYFFGRNVEGVTAYEIVGSVFVCCGDMICNPTDAPAFLGEILAFCKDNGLDPLFLNVTDQFLDLYRMAGFSSSKYGEDACFRLKDYTLAGKRAAKVRAAINHASKAGIEVLEYRPGDGRNHDLERQMGEITRQWLANKGGQALGFMMGSAGLENPLDRRYFYAREASGKVLGFVVFLPYRAGKAWLADVTRRRTDAPQGVLEKITWEAFGIFKEEGAEWGNLGLSPLFNVADDDEAGLTERLFNYIYENMNKSYDFKALHHAKEKYGPTHWESRWLAYRPGPFSPAFAYALVRVQAGRGLAKLFLPELVRKKEKKQG